MKITMVSLQRARISVITDL